MIQILSRDIRYQAPRGNQCRTDIWLVPLRLVKKKLEVSVKAYFLKTFFFLKSCPGSSCPVRSRCRKKNDAFRLRQSATRSCRRSAGDDAIKGKTVYLDQAKGISKKFLDFSFVNIEIRTIYSTDILFKMLVGFEKGSARLP